MPVGCLGSFWLRKKEYEATVEVLAYLDQELREGFLWQRRFADALSGYAEQVASALEALARVHEVLEDAGISDVVDTAPMATALLRGFREAREVARGTAKAVRDLLSTHCVTLMACDQVLAEADSAAVEVNHYSKKLEALEQEVAKRRERNGGVVPQKTQARLERNRTKLRDAERNADVMRTRATDSLQACVWRKDNLCQLARDAVAGTAKAFRRSVSYLTPVEDEDISRGPSNQVSPVPSPRERPGAPHPFGDHADPSGGEFSPIRTYSDVLRNSNQHTPELRSGSGPRMGGEFVALGEGLDLRGLEDTPYAANARYWHYERSPLQVHPSPYLQHNTDRLLSSLAWCSKKVCSRTHFDLVGR